MDGNVFTENLRSELPEDINTYLKLHKLKMYFKYELTQFFDADYSLRSSKKRLASMQSNKFKNLEKTLLSLCNTPINDEQIEKATKFDICRQYFRGEDWKSRSKRDGSLIKKGTAKKQININPHYFEGVISNVFNDFFENTDYDIILLVSTADETKKMSDRVVGFLITQYAECQDAENIYSNIPVLNLVCAPKKHKHDGSQTNCRDSCPIVGRVLLFMYIYALKKKSIKFGLLELAGLYCNISGLCLYNKFGFREDLSIKSPTCFGGPNMYGTLSMVSKISLIKYDDLYDALLKNKNIPLDDQEPLCSRPKDANNSLTNLLKMQQEQADLRMRNFTNIVKLQEGKLSLDDIEEIYFNNNKPKSLKNAIKFLSKYSKQGKILDFKKKRKRQSASKTRNSKIPKIPRNRSSRGSKTNRVDSFGFRNMSQTNMINALSDISKSGMKLHNSYTRKTKKTKSGGNKTKRV